MKFFKEIQEAYNKRDAYQRDYDNSVAGMGRPADHRGLSQELAHETNNIAIMINGRTWKVIPGRGYADSKEEWSYLNGMKAWAQKKSAATGKRWEVALTGAAVSETIEQGVSEGVAETMSMNDAVKVLRHYGADNFKTTSNELHFYKNGRPGSVELIMGADAIRTVSLSSLNSAARQLKGQGVAEGETPEKEIERLKLRQNAEHGKASLKRQAETQARIRELEKQIKDKESVAEGSEFGAYYYEQLAQQTFDSNPNLDDENEILNLGYSIAKGELGSRAQGIFHGEDFPSDFVSAYFYLKKQGVTEGSQQVDSLVTDALKLMRGSSMDDAVTALKTVLGDREFSSRRGFYNFYIRQLIDMYGKRGVTEGSLNESDSPVAGAITRRILLQRSDLLQKFGPEKVMSAIDDVADFVGDTEEIGSSDVSGWVKQVEQTLASMSGGIEEADMSTGNAGYDSMLSVMKAVDAGQDATFNLGGEPITLDYNEARFLAGRYKAFLKAGRQEEFLKYMESPVAFDRLMKQLRDLMDKQKNFRGSVQGERGVEEGAELKKAKRSMNQAAKDANADQVGAGKKIDTMKNSLRQKDLDKEQSVEEGIGDAIKAGAKKAFKALTGPDDEELIQRLEKETGGKRPEKKDLPPVKENEYYCRLDKVAKLIPEGYRKNEEGYLVRK